MYQLFISGGRKRRNKKKTKETITIPTLLATKIQSKLWEGMPQKSCLLYVNIECAVRTRLTGLN